MACADSQNATGDNSEPHPHGTLELQKKPFWINQQPFQSIFEDDMETFASFGEHGILEVVMATHAGNTTEEYESAVSSWLSKARHPRFDRPYTDLVYQPMLELINFLQNNDFRTFIVSGGGIDFMRVWVEDVYGIPNDQVVGSSVKTEFSIERMDRKSGGLRKWTLLMTRKANQSVLTVSLVESPFFGSASFFWTFS